MRGDIIFRYPFSYIIFITLSFTLGISFAIYFENTAFIDYVFIIAFIFLILLIISIVFIKNNYVSFILLLICLSLSAYLYTNVRYYKVFKNKLSDINYSVKAFSGNVVGYDGRILNRERYRVFVNLVYDGTNWFDASGYIRLYNNSIKKIEVGDFIIVNSKLNLYKNIFEFYNNSDDENNFDSETIIKSLNNKMLFGVSTIYREQNAVIYKKHSLQGIIYSFIIPLRDFIKQSISKHMDATSYSVVSSIFLGERLIIPYDIQSIFRDAGISHLLVVSGIHISIFIFIIFFLLTVFNINFYKKIIIATVLALCYLPLTLYSVSAMRAVVMATVMLFILLFDRKKNIVNALFLSALIILIASPNSVKDISFQFSFLATLGIILYFPVFRKIFLSFFKKMPKKKSIPHIIILYLFESFFVTLSALIATLPLSVHYFSVLNALSLITNIYAVLLSFLIIVISFIVVITSVTLPFLSRCFAATLQFITNILINLTSIFSSIKYLRYDINSSMTVAIIITIFIIVLGFFINYKFILINPKEVSETQRSAY